MIACLNIVKNWALFIESEQLAVWENGMDTPAVLNDFCKEDF